MSALLPTSLLQAAIVACERWAIRRHRGESSLAEGVQPPGDDGTAFHPRLGRGKPEASYSSAAKRAADHGLKAIEMTRVNASAVCD